MSTKTLSTFGELKLQISNQHQKMNTRQQIKEHILTWAHNSDILMPPPVETFPVHMDIEVPIDPALINSKIQQLMVRTIAVMRRTKVERLMLMLSQ